MPALHILALAIGCTLLADLSAASAKTGSEPLDRVAAVIGEQPIFLSEIRKRAIPHFIRIDATTPDIAQRAAAKKAVIHDLLERVIDERLEERVADEVHIKVDSSEVDAGMRAIGSQTKMSVADLLSEAKRQGMSEQDYRDEIRRQVLEGKLIQLRVRNRVKVTEADARMAYDAWAKEQTGSGAPVDLRILVLGVPKDATPAAKKTIESLATQIVSQAKSGTDFCTLVTKHSTDPSTKSTCGSRGPVPRNMLMPELQKAADSLKPGEVTAAPILFTDVSKSEAFLVVQRTPGSTAAIPSFESVKEKMMERAFFEATERERKAWLKDLRTTSYVDVKL